MGGVFSDRKKEIGTAIRARKGCRQQQDVLLAGYLPVLDGDGERVPSFDIHGFGRLPGSPLAFCKPEDGDLAPVAGPPIERIPIQSQGHGLVAPLVVQG